LEDFEIQLVTNDNSLQAIMALTESCWKLNVQVTWYSIHTRGRTRQKSCVFDALLGGVVLWRVETIMYIYAPW